MTTVYRTILSAVFILAGSSYLESQNLLSADSPSNAELTEFTSAMNKSAPVMVDKETRFEKAAVGDGVVTYFYTMINYRANEIDSEKFEETISKPVKTEMCSNPEMKKLLQQGVSIGHSYRGNDKVMIGELMVEPNHCGF